MSKIYTLCEAPGCDAIATQILRAMRRGRPTFFRGWCDEHGAAVARASDRLVPAELGALITQKA